MIYRLRDKILEGGSTPISGRELMRPYRLLFSDSFFWKVATQSVQVPVVLGNPKIALADGVVRMTIAPPCREVGRMWFEQSRAEQLVQGDRATYGRFLCDIERGVPVGDFLPVMMIGGDVDLCPIDGRLYRVCTAENTELMGLFLRDDVEKTTSWFEGVVDEGSGLVPQK